MGPSPCLATLFHTPSHDDHGVKSLEIDFQNIFFHRLPWSWPLFKGIENLLRQQQLQHNIEGACLHFKKQNDLSENRSFEALKVCIMENTYIS